ncbi:MAG TPA: hypothetical protein VG105_19575, partial [Paraburkholderia sp.]|nr:hypothetical protein [Paraburkholderia sp.]
RVAPSAVSFNFHITMCRITVFTFVGLYSLICPARQSRMSLSGKALACASEHSSEAMHGRPAGDTDKPLR